MDDNWEHDLYSESGIKYYTWSFSWSFFMNKNCNDSYKREDEVAEHLEQLQNYSLTILISA